MRATFTLMPSSPFRPAAALCALVLIASGPGPAVTRAACDDDGPWQRLVLDHLGRYPDMEVRDALKLLQQAALGSEHWVREGDAAHWMQREWSVLEDGPREPLVDTLGPDARFARIHLRAYRAVGGDPVPLVQAFVATAALADADTAVLRCALDALVGLARRGAVPWPEDGVTTARLEWASRGYPAIHHSTRFQQRYRPAYRVVALPLVPRVPETREP